MRYQGKYKAASYRFFSLINTVACRLICRVCRYINRRIGDVWDTVFWPKGILTIITKLFTFWPSDVRHGHLYCDRDFRKYYIVLQVLLLAFDESPYTV